MVPSILRSALPSSNFGASIPPPPLLLALPPVYTHSSHPYNVCQPASMTAPKAVKIWLALVLVACWVYSSLSRSPSFEDCVASSSFSPWDDEGVEFVFNASGECPASSPASLPCCDITLDHPPSFRFSLPCSPAPSLAPSFQLPSCPPSFLPFFLSRPSSQ